MGLMDKMKSAAQDVAAQAKVAAGQAQDKVGEVQNQRKLDDLAKQLGHAVYAERTGKAPTGDQTALVAQMQEVEAAMEAARATEAAQATATNPAAPEATASTGTAPPPQPNASEPTSGDFKL